MAKKHFIYKITNMANGKIYIGKTSHIEKRWLDHIKKSKTLDWHLYNSMRKYGIENFCMEIIEEVSNSRVDDIEQYWIAKLNTTDPDIGYNVHIGGSGGDTYSNRTDDEKASFKKIMSNVMRKRHTNDSKFYKTACDTLALYRHGNTNPAWKGYWYVRYPSGKLQRFTTMKELNKKFKIRYDNSLFLHFIKRNKPIKRGRFTGYEFFKSKEILI